MGEESINGIKMNYQKMLKFFQQEKFIYSAIVILLLLILFVGTSIRVGNLDLLKDSTTGDYIPTALDPFYFLRISETIIEQGTLPEVDSMRYIPAKLPFTSEILGEVVASMYKIMNLFGDYSLGFVNVISPVVFFALSLVVFFFLIHALTNSKSTALLSTAFLAIIPAYLFRTTAGFSDHESLGMLAFFLVLLVYTLGLRFLEKRDRQDENKKDIIKLGLFGAGIGFLTALTIVSWGGIANFLFMIFPLSFFVLWVLKINENENSDIAKYFIFYSVWFFSSILISYLFGYEISSLMGRFILSTSGLISVFVLGFLFSEYIFIKLIKKEIVFLKRNEKYRILFSISAVIVFGAILVTLSGDNFLALVTNIIERFFDPFGESRTGSTVAENAETYLINWIGQIGKIFFWLFYLGLITVGIEISKGIGEKKHKLLFVFMWIVFISGILFSRISSDSIFNGTNLISKLFHFGSSALFIGYSAWFYAKEKIKIKSELIIIASWLLFMLIAGRGSVRLMFLVVPFVVFMASFFVVKMFCYAKENKDEFYKMGLFVIFVISVLGMVVSGIGIPLNDSPSGFYQVSKSQAKQAGLSSNIQWQKAMAWTRENTDENSIFVHWWDYGYWVQYLGKRPTVTDGGHGVGYWDHLIGRYLLTTPNPESALSFMKTQDVSHLLIDPTDLGKYPAYSKIGGDEEGNDRFSQIPVMVSDPRQTQKSQNGTLRIYQGGVSVDEDLVYEDVFLPSGKAIIAGVFLEILDSGTEARFSQPQGAFVYNQNQINIPIRYTYYEGKLFDFGRGLDAVIRIIPGVGEDNGNIQIDNLGALIYLSPKVSKSLFAQLYLLDDAFGNYETISLAHIEQDPIVSNLNSQGANLKDFLYFGGFRGPIKIWKVDYPQNIIEREEFLETSGEYGALDNLKFTK